MPVVQSDNSDTDDTRSDKLIGGHNLRKRTPSPRSSNKVKVRRRPALNGVTDESDDTSEDEEEETRPEDTGNQSAHLSRLSSDLSRTTLNDSIYPCIDEYLMPESKDHSSSKKKRVKNRLSTQSPVSSRVPLHMKHCVEDDLSSCFNQTPASLHHHKEERRNNANNDDNFSWNWFFFVMICCSLIVVYITAPYFFTTPPGMVNQDSKDVANRLDDMLGNMKSMFPSQPSRIWKLIKSSLKRHLVTIADGGLPYYPSVLLMVANSTDETLSCMARKLGKQLSEIGVWSNQDCSEINLNSWRLSVPGILKLRLDEQITSLYEGGTRCIVLTQLEGIPAEGAKMLHAFCDNEFAPYKDLVLIMTMQMTTSHPLPDTTRLSTDYEWVAIDAQVENRLKDLWENNLGSVEMAAVLSRIANAIIPLTSESRKQLELACLN